MVLRRIFRTKRGEIAEGWRKLNDKLHNLFFSPNIVVLIKLGE
jgi:hypothetical protein